jgi:hypothetical protein
MYATLCQKTTDYLRTPSAGVAHALHIALARFLALYVQPLHAHMPTLQWQLQQICLRQTPHNRHHLQTLIAATPAARQHFIRAALVKVPDVVLAATDFNITPTAPQNPQRQIEVCIRIGNQQVTFAFEFLGDFCMTRDIIETNSRR